MVNWILLLGVSALVLGFGSSSGLASAYGIAVTLAEMALKSNIGVLVSEEQPFGVAESFFGEDQGLYLVTVCDTCLADFLDAAGRADVPVDPVGRTIKDRIVFELEGSDHQVTPTTLTHRVAAKTPIPVLRMRWKDNPKVLHGDTEMTMRVVSGAKMPKLLGDTQ